MNIVDISEASLKAFGTLTITDADRAALNLCITEAEGAVRRFLKYDPAQKQRTEFYPPHDYSRSSREALWEVSDTRAFLRRLAEASTIDLQLSTLPIRAPIIDLRIDYDGRSGARPGSFPDSSIMVEGTDYWPNYDVVDSQGLKVCNDGIIKSEGLWPAVSGAVKITYKAGYTPQELRGQDSIIDASPIWEATLDEVVRRMHKLYKMKKSVRGFLGPLQSENLGDYSYTADSQLLGRIIGGTDLLPESMEKLMHFENVGWMMVG